MGGASLYRHGDKIKSNSHYGLRVISVSELGKDHQYNKQKLLTAISLVLVGAHVVLLVSVPFEAFQKLLNAFLIGH